MGRGRRSRRDRPRRMPSRAPPPAHPEPDPGRHRHRRQRHRRPHPRVTRPRLRIARERPDRRLDRGCAAPPWQALLQAQGITSGTRQGDRPPSTTRTSSPISTPPASTSSGPGSTPSRCGASRSPTPLLVRPAHDRPVPRRHAARCAGCLDTRPLGQHRAVRRTRDGPGPLSAQSFLSDATAADLAAGAPDSVTVGIFLMSMLDVPSYPWEQIAASSFDPNLAEAGTDATGCDDRLRCGQLATFRYTFDPGPGEPTTFAAPTASLTTPAGTAPYMQYVWGSGPGPSIVREPARTPARCSVDGAHLQIPLPETAGGTVLCDQGVLHRDHEPWRSEGDRRADERRAQRLGRADRRRAGADLRRPRPQPRRRRLAERLPRHAVGQPGVLRVDRTAVPRSSTTRVRSSRARLRTRTTTSSNPPPPGKRLVVSTNATDGQISLVALLAGRRAVGARRRRARAPRRARR